MYKCGSAFKRLHKVWLQGVLEQRRHCAGRLKVAGRNGLALKRICYHHTPEPFLEVGYIRRKAQHRHDLAGNGYIKAVFTRHTLHSSAKAVHYVPQLPVVHIHTAAPYYPFNIYAQSIALLYMIIEHGGKQIVCRAYGMKIARKVKVYILHRHYLGIAAARSASLYAEYRTQ